MKRTINIFLLLALMALMICSALVAANCGDDDDDDDDNDDADDDDNDTGDDDDDTGDDDTGDDDTGDDDTGDDDTGDDDTGDDDTGDDDTGDDDSTMDDPPTEPITIHVIDFLSGSNLTGATCELVNRYTGESFEPAITTTADTNGFCFFNTVEKNEQYSVKFTLNNYVTTYAFNYDTVMTWEFSLVSNIARASIAALLGETFDPSKGIVGGIVQYYDDVTPAAEVIGCAEVTSDTSRPTYYIDGSGMPTTSRTSTHPSNGYFLITNVTPGNYLLTADTDGDEEGAIVPQVFADCIVYVNIYYKSSEYMSNPTPGGCTK